MNLSELKEKAASLPLSPGVYLMRDKDHHVIYVGKAKKLKNRVSQYFQNTSSHSPKTRLMVSNVYDFDVIIASNEFEALVLECAQIKRYMPKYNILLKDGKGYPYVRLDMREPFPKISLSNKIQDDGASYYGPFGSRGVTQNLIDSIHTILKLPTCGKLFPRDLGKGRPCLNYHMNQCIGWCQIKQCQADYISTMETARQLLLGNYKNVCDALRQDMIKAADELNFELAAALRNRINAIQALDQKQHVASDTGYDLDAIGYGETDTQCCFAVLHFCNGELVDKDYEVLPLDEKNIVVSSLTKQYYLSRGYAPKTILLPVEMDDSLLLEELLQSEHHIKTKFRVPQKGDNARLVELACKNAQEEVVRVSAKENRFTAGYQQFAKTLGISLPKRIESYDISNISGSNNVAGMVVFVDGKPCKREYKKFKVDLNGEQDDYGSMRQTLLRRFDDFLKQKSGFELKPDLLLIDGGATHARVAEEVLRFYQLNIPVFGMVKDDKHRTRALITAQHQEIRIDHLPSVFSFIGNIQEETHRYAISFHRQLRRKALRYSELDRIEGIGPVRKQLLLKHFSSISAIRAASYEELLHYLPQNAAQAVFEHFHTSEG